MQHFHILITVNQVEMSVHLHITLSSVAKWFAKVILFHLVSFKYSKHKCCMCIYQ